MYSQNPFSQENNKFLSVENEKDIVYEKRIEYLHVSSSDRDLISYPNVNNYSITLRNHYKNITNIELISVTIPNVVTTEPFVVLNIDELDGAVCSVNPVIDDAFAIIPLFATTSSWVHLNCNNELIEKIYLTPKSSINKMTIKLFTKGGALFDFGSGNADSIQNDFVFKITTLDKSRSSINIRSVY
jgi:hypothetical protein